MFSRSASSPRSSFFLSMFILGGFGLTAEGCGEPGESSTPLTRCGAVFCAQGEACIDGACSCPPGENCNVTGVSGSGGGSTLGSGGQGSATGGSTQTASGGRSGAGASSNSGGQTAVEPCTNVLPTDTDWAEADCEMWANQSDPPACDEAWFLEGDYCAESCGRCSGSTSGDGDGDGDGDGTGGSMGYGEGNPWGEVTGGQQAWASRYWDCCKQSCGWANNAGGNPVKSCNGQGSNQVSADDQSTCSGGQSTTCNSFTPWAYSSELSFGFVATHVGGASCGTCYHMTFTGQGEHNQNDPGSQAIAGKSMIVMATNIGGDVGGNQMDVLIPGGGTGAFYGCGSAWGVDQQTVETMGAQYGGLRSNCSGNDLNSIKSCVADKCQQLFGSRGLDDMYDGCMWYVNWMQAADNPRFRYETVQCPSELTAVAY